MTPWKSRLAVGAVLAASLLVAACGNGDAPPVDGDGIGISATEFAFAPSEVTAPAGAITLTLRNDGSAFHDLFVEDADGDVEVVGELRAGETASGTVSLAAGAYTYYCSVPGHRAQGMEGTLTVTE